MLSENSKIRLTNPLQKRFLYFSLLFSLSLILTLTNSTTPFKELENKKLILAEKPNFVIHKDISGKRTNIQYYIILKFKSFKDSLRIIDSDLNFAKRSAIKTEVNIGDTVLVTFHDQYLYVCQLTKNGKNYLNPSKAIGESVKIERAVFWVSLFSLVICIFGFVLVKKQFKYVGWISFLMIIVLIISVLIFIDISFIDPGNFSEF